MVKDIVVNLTGGQPQDFAAHYAISIAAALDAHIVGVGFIYEPIIPGSVLGGVPTDLIEVQREENTKSARPGYPPNPASSMPASRGPPTCSAESRGASTWLSSAKHSAKVALRRSC